MKKKITARQNNSTACLVCGLDNPLGLLACFYETADREVVALFTPRDEHQSYPGRLHGGIASAILDETIGRAILIETGEVWGVTVDLNLKFRKPLPLGVELKVVGRLDKESRTFVSGSGAIFLPDATPAVTASGRYLKLPFEKIAAQEKSDNFAELMGWKSHEYSEAPDWLEVPDLPKVAE